MTTAPCGSASRQQRTPSLFLVGFLLLLVVINLYSLQKPLARCTMGNNNDDDGESTMMTTTMRTTTIRTRNGSGGGGGSLIKVDDPHQVLPKTLYIVYGLESSGTTLLTRMIVKAAGFTRQLRDGHDSVESQRLRAHVQHLSLPLGATPASDHYNYHRRFDDDLPVVDVYLPRRCHVPADFTKSSSSQQQPTPDDCRPFSPSNTIVPAPERYFVNITSHVQWYRDRGVTVHPLLVVRDPSYRFQSVLKSHCSNETAALRQYEMGQDIIVQSLNTVQPVVVSYETLMTLGESYMTRVIYPQLGLLGNLPSHYNNNKNTATTSDDSPPPPPPPLLKNGNLKYAPPHQALTVHLLEKERPIRDAEWDAKERLARRGRVSSLEQQRQQ